MKFSFKIPDFNKKAAAKIPTDLVNRLISFTRNTYFNTSRIVLLGADESGNIVDMCMLEPSRTGNGCATIPEVHARELTDAYVALGKAGLIPAGICVVMSDGIAYQTKLHLEHRPGKGALKGTNIHKQGLPVTFFYNGVWRTR